MLGVEALNLLHARSCVLGWVELLAAHKQIYRIGVVPNGNAW